MVTSSTKRGIMPGGVLVIVSISFLFFAYSTGKIETTNKNGGEGCNCHSSTPNSAVTVTINGSDEIMVDSTQTYYVTLTGGALAGGGVNIAASGGTLIPGTGLKKVDAELTHTSPRTASGGSVTFEFSLTAPSTEDTVILFATGNSVNLNGSNGGDGWNFAENFAVKVVPNSVPVELNNFTAAVSGNDVNLKWITATEINNSGFELQRSAVKDNWESLGFIRGSGSSTEKKYYNYTDKDLRPGNYSYRLKQIDFDGSYTMYILESNININQPSAFVLQQNYPNPFNPATNISFSLSQPANVNLKVFNLSGEEVEVAYDGIKEAGYYSYSFNGAGLASGVYYYSLTAASPNSNEIIFSEVKKMLLLK